jgi:pimeloyl-ACP methyl ester carboxylesterase
MTAGSPIFKSAEAEAEFLAAYDAAMTLWPVPYEQRDLPTPFGSTHVIVSGPADGPPLVLLHCALMTSAIWSPIIGDLAREHRCYAVDVMGDVNRTVPTDPPTTEQEAAAWLSTVFDGLGLARAAVVAWSFGGGTATNFAMRHPDRVERLALLAPFKPFAKQGAGFLFGFLPFVFRSRGMAKRFERRMCFAGDFGHREHSELLYQRYRCGRFMLKVVPPRTFTDLEFRLLTMPTLLLVGEQEYLYDGPASVERANRVLPDGRGEVLANCNHAIVSDQTEIVTERLLEFLHPVREGGHER